MEPEYLAEDDPRRDDANRLGVLYETLHHELYDGAVGGRFASVLHSAFEAEFIARGHGAYPPAGHGYPRQD
ncbi:hypothetical protein [Phaeacidiphilus oryzae]|uniref:hypothetical protein n=1 Tax=Phaeacidiphilus oryzae TaxID=348818 RepID=UPI000562816F|nr:hypothetical protein [Phaeacidiphilus oryzae]